MAKRTNFTFEYDDRGNIDCLVRGEVRAIAYAKGDSYHIHDIRRGGRHHTLVTGGPSPLLEAFLKLISADKTESPE